MIIIGLLLLAEAVLVANNILPDMHRGDRETRWEALRQALWDAEG